MIFASLGWPSLPASKGDHEEGASRMEVGVRCAFLCGQALPLPSTLILFRTSGESGLEQNSLGTTTTKWAAWKARSCCAAVGPLNAEGDFCRGKLFLTLRTLELSFPPGTGSS